jgi:cysteine desulfurase
VLTAMGISPIRARGCVRFSLGIYNTDQDVDLLLEHLPAIISKLRSMSPADRKAAKAEPSEILDF